MKRLVRFTIAAFLLAAFLQSFQAGAQSLGELGRKEKQRREKIKANPKVITNEDTQNYKNGPVTTGSPQQTGTPEKPGSEKPSVEGDASSKDPKTAKSDEPTDFQGRTESFWRQTMADARKKVQDLENEANVLTLKLNDLQNKFYGEASGFKQQDIQREIQKTFYEQDKNKENLSNAKAQLQELEKDARKSGALPGWLNSKGP